MPLLDTLRKDREKILAIAKECGLKDVRVFGSVARGEERPDSDIDILVNYDAAQKSGLAVFGFPVELEDMYGRKVDMVFEDGLFWAIRDEVMKDAQAL